VRTTLTDDPDIDPLPVVEIAVAAQDKSWHRDPR
jgi:hypothetical protein